MMRAIVSLQGNSVNFFDQKMALPLPSALPGTKVNVSALFCCTFFLVMKIVDKSGFCYTKKGNVNFGKAF
jgi:hypothetical protein